MLQEICGQSGHIHGEKGCVSFENNPLVTSYCEGLIVEEGVVVTVKGHRTTQIGVCHHEQLFKIFEMLTKLYVQGPEDTDSPPYQASVQWQPNPYWLVESSHERAASQTADGDVWLKTSTANEDVHLGCGGYRRTNWGPGQCNRLMIRQCLGINGPEDEMCKNAEDAYRSALASRDGESSWLYSVSRTMGQYIARLAVEARSASECAKTIVNDSVFKALFPMANR